MIEFYYVDNFIGQEVNDWTTLLGIFLAALVPFIIFYISILSEKKKEAKVRKQELKSLSQYFIHLLKRVVGSKIFLEQADSKTQSAYVSKPLAKHGITIEMAGDLSRISKLDANVVRIALSQTLAKSNKETNQVFISIYAIIDFYLEHSEHRVQRINSNSKQRDELGERLVNALDDFRLDLWEIMILRIHNSATRPIEECLDMFEEGLQSYEHHVDIGNSRDFDFAKKNVLLPIFEASKKHREIEQVYPDLYRKAYKLSYLFSRVEACGIDLKDSLQSINTNLKEENTKLVNMIRDHFDPTFLKETNPK